jgi:hypothetical protein
VITPKDNCAFHESSAPSGAVDGFGWFSTRRAASRRATTVSYGVGPLGNGGMGGKDLVDPHRDPSGAWHRLAGVDLAGEVISDPVTAEPLRGVPVGEELVVALHAGH